MNREEAVKILHEALPGLRQRYGVLDLGLFESVARNEAGPDSDVDILVTLTQIRISSPSWISSLNWKGCWEKGSI